MKDTRNAGIYPPRVDWYFYKAITIWEQNIGGLHPRQRRAGSPPRPHHIKRLRPPPSLKFDANTAHNGLNVVEVRRTLATIKLVPTVAQIILHAKFG